MLTEKEVLNLTERRLKYGIRFEEIPCETARLEDLNLDLFRYKYLPFAVGAEVIEEDERSIQEQLTALQFFNHHKECPTNLGMLLFGKHPELFIPSTGVQYVRFAGPDNGSDILQEHAFKGPLIKIIEELDVFVKTGIAATYPVLVSALREEKRSPYPFWAVRELLLNAIIHRDYALGNLPVKLYEYESNRLEISNPGGLFGMVSPDNFPHVNDYRNPIRIKLSVWVCRVI